MLSSQGADEATFDQLLESMSSNTSTQTQPTSGPTGMLASVPPISDADRLLTSQELNQLSESVSRVLSYKGCTVDELHTALESTTFRQLVQLHDHFIEEGKGNLIGSMSLIYENAGMRSEFYAALAFCMAASSQQSAQPSRMCRNEARIAISLALEAASYLQDNNGEALARRLEMVHESPNFHFTVQAYDLIFGGTPG
ncbi:MAG: hypothetical protein KDD64_17325, partial [Bdellovibrionales bacterium]|nr:hypothetical protein [Bdellovibrionales bacterium]